MKDLKNKYSLFKKKIKEIEIYESKSFFKKLFSSSKPNEEEIIVTLNDFVSSTLTKEILKFKDLESFKTSFNWYDSVSDYLYPENCFKILNTYQELPFLDDKTMIAIENVKRLMQMQIREADKLDDMLKKFT